MALKINKEAKIGLFAVVALAALYFGYNFLRGRKFFSGQDKYFVVYNSIEGISNSTPVYYNGLKVGQVEDLGFLRTDSANHILVKLMVNNKVQLYKSSQARIVNLDLLGGKAIYLIMPDFKEPIEEGDTLLGNQEIGLGESITGMIGPVKDKTELVLLTLDKVLLQIQNVLSKGGSDHLSSGIQDLAGTMKNLKDATAQLNRVLQSQSGTISKTASNLEAITSNFKKSNDDIHQILQNMNELSDSLSQAPVKHLLVQLDKTSSELLTISQKMNQGQGSAGKMVNDPELYNNLNKSASELNSLLKDFKEYPARYINVSLFGSAGKKAEKKRQADLKKQP